MNKSNYIDMAIRLKVQKLVKETCCNCGIVFAMDESFYEQKRENGTNFYCPNGHSQYYTNRENKEKKIKELKEKLAKERALRKRREEEVDWFMSKLKKVESQKKSITYSRGQYKWRYEDLKEKLKNGQCPYCDEHIDGLRNHLESEHPDKMK